MWPRADRDRCRRARPGWFGRPAGGVRYRRGSCHCAGSIVQPAGSGLAGGAIFYVSNDRTGTLLIKKSTLRDNPSDGFFTAGYPGIFFLGQGHPIVISATIS